MRILKHGCILLLLISWIWPLSVAAQFVVVSSNPAHGAVNVPLDAGFQVTFSQAVEVNNDDGYEQYAVLWELNPDSSESMNAFELLSADSLTLTLSGTVYQPDTKYVVLIPGATAADGTPLDRPYTFTFTTGSALPGGSISGNVTYDNGSPAGTVVGAWSGEVFSNRPQNMGYGIAGADGSYTIDYLPTDDYIIFAMLDKDKNGEATPVDYDPLGGWDPDANKLVEPLHISETTPTTNVDIKLADPVFQSARTNLTTVQGFAAAIAPDAVLTGLFGAGIDPNGDSPFWFYQFWSAAVQQRFGFTTTSVVFLPGFPGDNEDNDSDSSSTGVFPFNASDTLALPDGWIDSDAAAAVAIQNGLADFLAANPVVEGGLYGMNVDPAELDLFSPQQNGSTIAWQDKLSDRNLAKKRRMADRMFFNWRNGHAVKITANDQFEPLWVWVLMGEPDFSSPVFNFFDYLFFFAVNMVDGSAMQLVPQRTTAKDDISLAKTSAADSIADAQLVAISAVSGTGDQGGPLDFSNVSVDGKAYIWTYLFQSLSADSLFALFTTDGRVTAVNGVDSVGFNLQPLPENFINSDEAFAVALAQGGQTYLDAPDRTAYLIASLLFGINPADPGDYYWKIEYHDVFDFTGLDTLTVFVNALNGSTVDWTHHQMPVKISLDYSYPNPVAPGHQFHLRYTLNSQSRVELQLYNILGQQVQRIFIGEMESGTHSLQGLRLNPGLARGLYFVRLKVRDKNGKATTLARPLLLQ